jgi:hypothetical protein
VTLFYFEQRAYEEVAAMLGIPLGTVKTLLFRAKKELIRIGARQDRSVPDPVLSAQSKSQSPTRFSQLQVSQANGHGASPNLVLTYDLPRP